MLVKVKAAAKWSVIGLIGMVALFFLVAWIGSSIGRNGEWTEPVAADERTIEIMVGSNGIHTEIAMPLVTREKDWRTTFSIEDIRASTRPYTHVAVSWGERAFFLETPEWTDLTVTTAANAMTGGEAVLHVAYYVRPAPSDDYRVLRLRESEYRALVQSIESHLVEADNRETIPGYSWHDVFYSAHGTYHIGNTCNQWTSDQLAAAGVNVGIWSPLPGGVMKWVPDAP
ncbi:MAG: TIGR02117 family protein [Erythrobacter sp.]